jgi:hypothetical protein
MESERMLNDGGVSRKIRKNTSLIISIFTYLWLSDLGLSYCSNLFLINLFSVFFKH